MAAQAAAVGVPTPGGGPEQLLLFLVLHPAAAGQHSEAEMQRACQSVISAELNPLFRVARVLLLPGLPRNASNKVMRRLLRDQAVLQAKEQQGRQPGHVVQLGSAAEPKQGKARL
ncbi:hypothetical protein V8C86DRAFT_586791 [Haematococcus lacustris]